MYRRFSVLLILAVIAALAPFAAGATAAQTAKVHRSDAAALLRSTRCGAHPDRPSRPRPLGWSGRRRGSRSIELPACACRQRERRPVGDLRQRWPLEPRDTLPPFRLADVRFSPTPQATSSSQRLATSELRTAAGGSGAARTAESTGQTRDSRAALACGLRPPKRLGISWARGSRTVVVGTDCGVAISQDRGASLSTSRCRCPSTPRSRDASAPTSRSRSADGTGFADRRTRATVSGR